MKHVRWPLTEYQQNIYNLATTIEKNRLKFHPKFLKHDERKTEQE